MTNYNSQDIESPVGMVEVPFEPGDVIVRVMRESTNDAHTVDFTTYRATTDCKAGSPDGDGDEMHLATVCDVCVSDWVTDYVLAKVPFGMVTATTHIV